MSRNKSRASQSFNAQMLMSINQHFWLLLIMIWRWMHQEFGIPLYLSRRRDLLSQTTGDRHLTEPLYWTTIFEGIGIDESLYRLYECSNWCRLRCVIWTLTSEYRMLALASVWSVSSSEKWQDPWSCLFFGEMRRRFPQQCHHYQFRSDEESCGSISKVS